MYSQVRTQLLLDSAARPHTGHVAWRAVVLSGDERPGGTVLTIGDHRTRGGYHRVASGRTMWMVNQFDAGELTGRKRDQALTRAGHLSGGTWHRELRELTSRTPEESIPQNQIMLVPELPRWTGERVALIGDAAHGLSPHISAGGTLGIEDAGVLRDALDDGGLEQYESARMARFDRVREFSAAVERAGTPGEYASAYAAFTRWMLSKVSGSEAEQS